ncbi:MULTISPECIES: isochorismatase family protein [Brevibacillus]|uniref:isochorismatase family protein n=1 Tax=Brevibacillus TaxID=55080 RepID=UPI0004115252|nr:MULTISPECIES: isochorismatase family protein [Brevibacillus]MED1824678.1 isochorismatase family protein [Brevibacillus agri]QHZ54888.1 isochorismatase family protein [Brevibacillus sp. NSP2.1]
MIRKTALLIIDAQTGIVDGPAIGPVFQNAALVTTIKKVRKEAWKRAIPVLYVQDTDVAEAGADAFAIHPELAPLPTETVVLKQSTDAFHGTDLHDQLQLLEINHLVITGCKTEYGVDSACRRATTLGYDVTLVRDGHSTTDNAVLAAEQIIAHHNACLHGLGNIDPFILVRDSTEDLFTPTHDTYR